MSVTQRTQLTQPRPDLASAFVEFDVEADQMGFVGHRIFPVIETPKSFGKFPHLKLRDLLGSNETRRAADGSYNSVTIKGDQGQYATEEHGIESPVDANDDVAYEDWWDAEQIAAMISRDRTIRGYEARAIALALTVTNDTSAGTAWSNKSSATVYAKVLEAKKEVRSRTGIVPDCMVLDWEAFENARNTDDILDRLFGSVNPENAGQVGPQMLAAALDLRHVFVAGAVKNTANEGQAASVGSMWDRTQALVFKGGEPSGSISALARPRLGATFHWGADGSRFGGMMESYEDPSRRSTIIRHRQQTDEVMLYDSLGERITGVLS